MASLGSILGTGAGIAITIQAIDEFSDTFNKASKGVQIAGAGFAALTTAVVATGAALAAVGTASVRAAADFEQSQIAFTTMMGSAEEAQKMLEELANFAKKTPFTLQGVEKSARQLMAVGFEADEILPTLKNVGDVAAGLGLGEEGLQRLILNLGQVQSQGKLTGRELRDFAVAGVPLLDELSKQLGVTTSEVQDMISAGEVSTDMVTKAFATMTSEGGRFANLMEKQSTSLVGIISNIKDSFQLMARELGMDILPIVKDVADMFLKQVMPAIQPLIPLIGDALITVLETLVPYLPRLVEDGTRLFQMFMKIFDAVLPLLEPLMELTFAILEPLMDIIEPLIPILSILAELLGSSLTEALKIVNPVLKVLADVLTTIFEILEPVVELIGKLFSYLQSRTIGAIGSLLSGITGGGGGSSTSGRSNIRMVNDAIIRPNGQIIETNPNDTLIATQNPGGLGGGVNVTITGNIYGVNANDIADALQKKLNTMIRR